MLRATLLLLFLLPSILFADPHPKFNPATVCLIEGEVASTRLFNYVTKPTPHRQLLLRTQNGGVTVDLGPAWYLESQGFTIMHGERLAVKGSVLKLKNSFFMIATCVRKGEQTYVLRNNSGKPIWRKR